MGLDQHRAQITAEWLDTETGEVSRARVTPADRAGVRRFLARFAGQRLEVALEATTGWRFVVEEPRDGRRTASGRAGRRHTPRRWAASPADTALGHASAARGGPVDRVALGNRSRAG